MNLERYDYLTNTGFLNYEFYSNGPKGKIKKIVRFTPWNTDGKTFFNLGFGDWDETKQIVDDQIISNNQDRDKILATIASIVLKFTEYFPDVWVHAVGSCLARTRLYQMGITKYWFEIEPLLYVYGLHNDRWESFKPNINYNAFFILRKKM